MVADHQGRQSQRRVEDISMSYRTIEVRKLTPHIGGEIFGVDLSKPLGNQQFKEVHDALMDRLVMFFRDQTLGIEQHKDFGRCFGKLHMHPASPDVVPDHPEVLIIKADDKAKYIPGEDWHSDVSCVTTSKSSVA
jgi:taurine dioxygenase